MMISEAESITFKTLSSEHQYRINKGTTVGEMRQTVASTLGTEYWLIDIVNMDNFFVYDTETTSDVLHDPFYVMVWAESRPVSGFPTSTKPDIVWEYESDPRLELPCGHAITPDNLYGLVREKILQNEHTLWCPAKTDFGICNQIWDNQEILEKCMLSLDEHIFFSAKLSFNYLNRRNSDDIKTCPKCGSYCKKIRSCESHVKCLKCSNDLYYTYKFCWYCMEEWSFSHECVLSSEYGNNVEILSQLLHCPRITLDYSNMGDVPSKRLCPNCKTLLQHDQACKSMLCTFCKTEFCFACLKVARDGKLPCGEFDGRCVVAPIQSMD
ncbi:ankyrin repeat and IBR domain-containing protein 1-like [Saccostrea cucullata]|uniref:ankyrin repeat and IBR domain-containing protein 1-like n=1 Tax=Saccostrea cuccullata TaxID=36930 RepID=UPI002ED149B9